MTFGLPVSVLLHAALLAWAIFVVTRTPPLRLPDEFPVEVALISIKDFETRQKKGDINAKQSETAPQPKPAEVVARQVAPKPKPPEPGPPPPPAAAEPPPPKDTIAEQLAALPEPKPEPPPPPEKDPIAEALALEQAKQKAEAEARAKAEAEARAKAEAEAKRQKELAEKKKREDVERKRLKELADKKKREDDARKAFDPNRIAKAIEGAEDAPQKATIDKDPTKRGAPLPPSDALSTAKAKGPGAGTKDGKDSRLSAREEDLLKGLIKTALARCWRVPGGGSAGETPVVTVKWFLRPDGSLDGEPRVVDRIASPAAQAAADAAVRAVIVCAPFSLPPDKYSAWREITWEFDPRSVL